jgi:hypothetical protein
MLSHEAVLVESHDVDERHVDALAGRGHAHQLTLVSSGRPHARHHFVAAGQNIFGVHAEIRERRAIHAKELEDTVLGWREAGSFLVLDEVVCQQSAEPVDVSGIEQVIKPSLRGRVVHRGPSVVSGDPTWSPGRRQRNRPVPAGIHRSRHEAEILHVVRDHGRLVGRGDLGDQSIGRSGQVASGGNRLDVAAGDPARAAHLSWGDAATRAREPTGARVMSGQPIATSAGARLWRLVERARDRGVIILGG